MKGVKTVQMPNHRIKDSGISWIGDIPVNWDILPLKYVANVLMGQSPPSKDVTDKGRTPFLQGNAEFGIEHPNPIHYCDSASKKCSCGDILMSVRAPVGETNLADQQYAIGRGLCAVTSKIDKEFMRYALKKYSKDFLIFANGSTFEAITMDTLKNFRIAVPPSDIQSSIVSYLNPRCALVEDIVRYQTQVATKLRELKQSIITEVVTKGLNPEVQMRESGVSWIGDIPEGWDTVKMKHQVTTRNEKTSNFTSYLGLENVESWSGRYISSESEVSGQDSMSIRSGDLCFSKLRPYLAKAIISPFDGACSSEFVVISDYVGDIRYLKYLMLTPGFIEVVNSNTYGTKMPRASWDHISSIHIPRFSKEEQAIIADYLDNLCLRIDTIIDEIATSIDYMQSYRESVIYEYVTGKKNIPSEVI